MSEIELSAGTVEFTDTGGGGPVVVLLHGLLMDETLWDGVVAELSADHRCVVPTMPLGAHRRPVRPGADLSLPGIARLVEEFLDRLDLRDVTLVGNDTGGALVQLVACVGPPRVQRIVIASCEAFDNVPPGLTGRTVALAGKLPPPLFRLFFQQMRLRPLRRLPLSFGWLTRRGDAACAGWIRPVLHSPGIAGDAVRVIRALVAEPDLMQSAAQRLPAFTRPALVIWAREDRVMPPEHGRRFADLFPDSRLVEIEDSSTLIPLDQPVVLARHIREFVAETA